MIKHKSHTKLTHAEPVVHKIVHRPKTILRAVVVQPAKKVHFYLTTKTTFWYTLAGVLMVIGLYLMIGTWAVYQGRDNATTRGVARFLQLPALSVDGRVMTAISYYEKFSQIQKLLASNPSADQSTMALNQFLSAQLVNDAIMANLAKKYNVVLNQSDVDARYALAIKSQGNENQAKKQLAKFGYSVKQYKKQLADQVLQSQVKTAVQADSQYVQDTDSRRITNLAKVDAALAAGETFEAVAKKYSDNSVSRLDGEAGLQDITTLSEQVAVQVKSLADGQVMPASVTIKHISYRVKRVKTVGVLVQVRLIAINPKPYSVWLGEYMGHAKLVYYLPQLKP